MILPTVKDLSGPFKSYNLNNGAHQASTDVLRSRVRRLPVRHYYGPSSGSVHDMDGQSRNFRPSFALTAFIYHYFETVAPFFHLLVNKLLHLMYMDTHMLPYLRPLSSSLFVDR